MSSKKMMPEIQPIEVRPVLKWAGGKAKLAPRLVSPIARFLQETDGVYWEPFLGAGAVALGLGYTDMMLSDALDPLIETHVAIRNDPSAVFRATQRLAERHGGTQEGYYKVRGRVPRHPYDRAARFIYLNKFGFNGLYRENKKGVFNVPWGGDRCTKRPAAEILPSEGELTAVSMAFRGASFRTCSFEVCLGDVMEGDVVYADPPYDGTFAAYTAGKFEPTLQTKLAEQLHAATRRGAFVLATNADTPFVRGIYQWATLIPTQERRAINSDGANRGDTPCLIITNKPELME